VPSSQAVWVCVLGLIMLIFLMTAQAAAGCRGRARAVLDMACTSSRHRVHGPYTTIWTDRGGRPSATEVHPEWQDLALGDYVKYWTRKGPMDAWEVAALEPNRFLGLRGLGDLRGRQLEPKQPRPSAYTEGLWAFLLKELPGGRTPLVISGYQTFRPRWLERFVNYWLYVPVVWPMQARMLTVLKRNIERANRARTQAVPSGETA
jgi:hypothetical protein